MKHDRYWTPSNWATLKPHTFFRGWWRCRSIISRWAFGLVFFSQPSFSAVTQILKSPWAGVSSGTTIHAPESQGTYLWVNIYTEGGSPSGWRGRGNPPIYAIVDLGEVCAVDSVRVQLVERTFRVWEGVGCQKSLQIMTCYWLFCFITFVHISEPDP